MDNHELSHVYRQKKRRELEKLSGERENLRIREQQLMDDIKNMETDMIYREKEFRKEAEEINKDDIFATNEIKKKELDLAKERGDAVVKLQNKRQQLENERNRIMKDLDKVTNGRNYDERPKSSLSNAGADIMGNRVDFDRADLDPAIKDKIIADQVKINHLREEQMRTNNLMEDMDELDILESQLNNKVKHKPVTTRMPQQHSFDYGKKKDPLKGFNQTLPPKAFDSTNIGNDLNDLKSNYVNNGGEDPNLIDKINDLDDFVNNRAPKSVRNQLGVENGGIKMVDHMAPKPFAPPPVAPISGLPYGGFPGMPPYGVPPPAPFPQYGGFPPFNPYANNPNLGYMDSLVRQTEEENKKLQEELERLKNDDIDFNDYAKRAEDDVEALKKQLMPGIEGEQPFPEDFVFRQNDFRSEDLEVEERALMNIAAQEYDHLRLLSRLPVNSELYRYKMDQYKELSTMRSEIEKVLHEQRLEKIRRDFEKQKYEDERHYNHERWLEEQKREILAAKLKRQEEPYYDNPYNDPDEANYNQPPDYPGTQQRPATNQFPPKTAFPKTQNTVDGGEKVYDPKIGFLAFFDVVSNIPRQHKGMQVVYGAYNNGRALTENRQVAYQDAETDPEQPDMNRVVYDIGHQIKHVQPHPSANLIIECQVPDYGKDGGENRYTSYGWTVVNLFDFTYDFHAGEFKLPLYTGQTLADIDCRDINTLEPLDYTFICMRLAIPGDEIATSQYLPEKSTSEYRIPSIHNVRYKPRGGEDDDEDEEMIPSRAPPRNQDYANAPMAKKNKKPAPTDKDPFYRCAGINVFVHYVKQFPTQSTIKVGATILEENNVVRIGHDQTECNWMSNPVDASKTQMARWKSQTKAQPDGAPIIDRDKDNDNLDYVGHRKKDYDAENEDIIIQVNNEVTWEHDFYKMLWDKNLRNDLFLIVSLFESAPSLNKRIQPSSYEYVTVGYG